MIYDGHIHIGGAAPNRKLFLERLAEAGVAGGAVISLSPACFRKGGSGKDDGRERLDGLFERTEGCAELFPLFWIDPLEGNAFEQVEIACGYGVAGFKVICDRYYPWDARPMEVFSRIAGTGKPILFHSGILWDGKFSSPYNRPAGFEALLGIGGGLRFALAHASWPWIDECIALYGKMLNARSEGNGAEVEMFVDITPGTPEIYREELLTKLFTVGYDIEDNVIFGSDCGYDDYNAKWVRSWADRDAAIYSRLKLGKETVGKVFSGNLKRFLGLSGGKTAYRSLTSADS